jgi:hypothetical protein
MTAGVGGNGGDRLFYLSGSPACATLQTGRSANQRADMKEQQRSDSISARVDADDCGDQRSGGSMTTIRVAFWNVENLFHWRLQHEQGPKTPQEYEAKVRAVAQTITSLFGMVPPDAVGLAEVGSRQVLGDILALLPIGYVGRYSEGAGSRPGLAFIFNPNAFEVSRVRPYPDKATTYNTNSRPWYIKARVTERTTGIEMLIVVNHWKSNVLG